MRVPVFLTLLLLGGCSTFKFFYNQLDWTVPIYVDSYVSLNEDQYETLEVHLNKLLSWHCNVQLGEYAKWVYQLAQDARSKNVSADQFARYYEQLILFRNALAKEAAPRVAQLLYGISDAQIDELFENLADKNADFKDELIDASDKDIEEELYERMEERLEKWVGDLLPGQKKAVKQWSQKAKAWQRQRLDNRKSWQQALLTVMRHKQDQRDFSRHVQDLMLRPENYWDSGYKQIFSAYRSSIYELLQEVFSQLSPSQSTHLQERLLQWGEDLQDLSCNKEASNQQYVNMQPSKVPNTPPT